MKNCSLLSLAVLAIAASTAVTAQTSTHDDPIVIDKGSVNITFGNHTKALSTSGLWAQQAGGRFLYHQHTHMLDNGPARQIQSLFSTKNSMLQAKRQHTASLSVVDQKNLRIEVFLKGKAANATAFVPIPGSQPHIVLSAVQVATPCCAHPNPNAPSADDQCASFVPHASIPTTSSTFPWSWQISSDRMLKDSGVIAATQTKRGAPLRRMQYVHPDFVEVEIDYWKVYNRRQLLFESRESVSKVSNVRDCPAIEICAVEKAIKQNGPMCERAESTCGPSKKADTGGVILKQQ